MRRAFLIMVLTAGLVLTPFGLGHSEAACGPAPCSEEGDLPYTESICGIDFAGTTHYSDRIWFDSKDRLHFSYKATTTATADLDGTTVKLRAESTAADVLLGDDLIPPGADLRTWVEENLDLVVRVSASFDQKISGTGKDHPKLKSQLMFRANQHGVTKEKAKFATNLTCA